MCTPPLRGDHPADVEADLLTSSDAPETTVSNGLRVVAKSGLVDGEISAAVMTQETSSKEAL